ncbi:MAG TPA: peptidase M48 [Cytophagales bacterium]|jgi:predicted Zn-dependent protease|nr:peptidase M48 [Cytophagales bacterium]
MKTIKYKVRILLKSGFLMAAMLMIYSCATVPVTGRSQLSLISNSEILPMSFSQYEQVMDSSKLSDDKEKVQMIKTVGNRIQLAVEEFMREKGHSDELNGYEWEFNLIDADVANAWCMPGGKVAFYTGILPICKDETGVAVVMGHEVAHAIANHGRERMSQGLVQQMGGVALSVALDEQPEQTQALFGQAYAIGSSVGVMLPFSRLHESEADKLGLYFMALAGYDPNEAPKFWERMKAASGGQAPPEFLSTHPSNETRINDLKAEIPKAMEYYREQ